MNIDILNEIKCYEFEYLLLIYKKYERIRQSKKNIQKNY